MKLGLIPQLTEYYFTNDQWHDDLQRAIQEFFTIPTQEELEYFTIPDEHVARLNEWFIFDFHLRNGKTPLQHFIEQNPLHLASDVLQDYRELDEHIVDLFEICDLRLNQGFTLRALSNGKTFDVVEHTGTHGVQQGHLIATRIAQINGQWEMIGADPAVFPIRITTGMRKFFRKQKNATPFNPKVIYDTFIVHNDEESPRFSETPQPLDRAEVEQRMQATLKRLHLSQYIELQQSNNGSSIFPKRILCNHLS